MIPFKVDPFTHALAGATIKQLGFKRKAALGVLLLSSLAPDFDYITRFWGADIFLRYHRGVTHGIVALVLFPLVIALIVGFKKGFLYYFFLSLLAYGAHLFMDLTNQYGTRILSPLDWEQYALDLSFIIDPYVTLGLLLCVILGWRMRDKAQVIAVVTVVLLASYFGLRYYLHDKTEDFLKARLDANTYKMCPLPNDFLRWWFVARSGNEYITGFADLFTQRICIQDRYLIDNRDPFIQSSLQDKVVQNFLYFAKYPFAEVSIEEGRTVVIWRELAYSFRADNHFVTEVVFDKEGKIVRSRFTF